MDTITPAGHARFLALMRTPSEYSRDTPEVFLIKLTKFHFLTRAQQQAVSEWYQGYLHDLRTYYEDARSQLLRTAEATEEEHPWIVLSVDAQLHALEADLAFLDGKLTNLFREEAIPT